MKTLLLAVGFSLLISGCGGAESDAKKAVLGRLKDPDSAKFGKFTQVNEKNACLTVNARNAMGGYTGDQQAALTQVNKEWVVSSIDEISHDNCISSIKYLEQQVLEAQQALKNQQVLEQQRNELVKKQVEMQLKRCAEVKDCFEMVVIPAGRIWKNEAGSAHWVALKSFELGKTEVTQGQWKVIMGSNPSKFSNCGDTCPVEQVSWNDAQEFIGKLNQKTGKQYRLPNQAEWDYACDNGDQLSCGASSNGTEGWFGGNSNGQTHPAGQYKPNNYGLYDMSGNVWEWTNNCDNVNCKARMLRGGSWDFDRSKYTAIDRDHNAPGVRYDTVGFRVARTLP